MKNPNSKVLLIAALVALGVVGGAFFALKNKGTSTVSETTAATQTSISSDVNYDSASLPAEPLGVRTLGNPNAPVKIEEFASLTCGHCANFHGTTFLELKEKYIDTGTVFFTFTDFPLNVPALTGSMVARCLPPEQYFSFLGFLFSTQEQWAFSQNYEDALRQNAKLAGMTDEAFDSCINNEELKQGLVNRMQEKGTAHNISSTPSFIINGQTVLTGALPILSFDKAIADALGTDESAVPAAEEAADEAASTPEETPVEDSSVTVEETVIETPTAETVETTIETTIQETVETVEDAVEAVQETVIENVESATPAEAEQDSAE